jgi:hypothetical protein
LSIAIGIIAEDKSDVSVMRELTAKVLPKNQFSVKQFYGSGSARIRAKCRKFADQLVRRGCTRVVVVHDLDASKEEALRKELEDGLTSMDGCTTLVLIPERTIEAWLLSDADAIKRVFTLKKLPKVPHQPESLMNPKEWLGNLVWKLEKKKYVNTIHNEKIAAAISIQKVTRRKSFALYPAYLNNR